MGNAAFEAWFADPARFDFTLLGSGAAFVDGGEPLAAVPGDFCGTLRDATPDIGAVEYLATTCATATALPLLRPPPSGPPVGPVGSLRAVTTADRASVSLSWSAGSDVAWNVYRSPDLDGSPATLHQPGLGAPATIDPGAARDGLSHGYDVRAVSPCTGVESP